MKYVFALRIILVVVISLGVVTIVGGFMYDILFAGIPYQDPPPDLQARYEADQDTAASIMTLGFYITIPGCLLLVASLFFKVKRKP